MKSYMSNMDHSRAEPMAVSALYCASTLLCLPALLQSCLHEWLYHCLPCCLNTWTAQVPSITTAGYGHLPSDEKSLCFITGNTWRRWGLLLYFFRVSVSICCNSRYVWLVGQQQGVAAPGIQPSLIQQMLSLLAISELVW